MSETMRDYLKSKKSLGQHFQSICVVSVLLKSENLSLAENFVYIIS
jgi:hypothetical protein